MASLQSGSEHHPAQHPALAGDAQLAMVEVVHASEAAAQHRAPGGRHEEEGGRTRENQAGAGQGVKAWRNC